MRLTRSAETNYLKSSGLLTLVLMFGVSDVFAVCPPGTEAPIFCDTYDCYCSAADCTQDPPILCQEGNGKNNTPMRAVWDLTSKNLNNNFDCGSEFNLEDTLQVFSEPF